MTDESTDVALEEELLVCARRLHQNKPVEHFFGVIQAKETNADAIAGYISDFLQSRDITFEKMCVVLALMVLAPCRVTGEVFRHA